MRDLESRQIELHLNLSLSGSMALGPQLKPRQFRPRVHDHDHSSTAATIFLNRNSVENISPTCGLLEFVRTRLLFFRKPKPCLKF
ncbi:hypothetical protein TNCV_5101581 [Trichonephila clavipes]|nr:hypothetical protein TNCV_5101581 [Trichonephila clavipes]